MKVKYLATMAFVFAILYLPSCSNKEEIKPQITVSSGADDIFRNGLVFPSDGGEFEIIITTNVSWTISFDKYQDWCTLSEENGEAGTHHIKVKTLRNTTYDDRVCEVSIIAEDCIRRFRVSQNRKEALLLSQKNFNVNTAEQDIYISIKSNVDYSVTIKNADWIKEEFFQSRGLTDNSIKLYISENESYNERTGIVVISSKEGSHSEEISVTQSAKDIIMLDNDVFTFDENGGIFSVGVTSNVDYHVTILCDWITEVNGNETRSLLTSYKTFQVKEMPDEANRDAIISFYYPLEQGRIDIKVYQHSTFSFDVYTISLMEGGTQQIVLNNEKGLDVTWSSNNNSIATVDNNGNVTAISAGTAIVTATASDGKHSCKCIVDVKSISNYISFNAGVSLEVGNIWKTKFMMHNSSNEHVKIDRIEVQQNGLFVKSFEDEGYLWGNSSREFTMDILTGWIKFITNYSYGGKSYMSTYSVEIIDTGYGYSVGN